MDGTRKQWVQQRIKQRLQHGLEEHVAESMQQANNQLWTRYKFSGASTQATTGAPGSGRKRQTGAAR
jgi:hypothetical protein